MLGTKHLITQNYRARLIGLDWGTTSLRAYLLGNSTGTLEQRWFPAGIMHLPGVGRTTCAPVESFEMAFEQACASWLQTDPSLPIIASGMVGSAQGWHEVPYLRAPFDLAQLGNHLTQIKSYQGALIHIVPGLMQTSGFVDVMRGEETQVLGALPARNSPAYERDVLFGFPGTHSKWVLVSCGKVCHFATFMTGEVYGALCAHTILSQTMCHGSKPDLLAFDRGVSVASSAEGKAGVLSNIFSTRTLGLSGLLLPEEQLDYLSGVLVGHEIEALSRMGSGRFAPHKFRQPIVLAGEESLCARYLRALKLLQYEDVRITIDATQRGLWRIGVQAGLVKTNAVGGE